MTEILNAPPPLWNRCARTIGRSFCSPFKHEQSSQLDGIEHISLWLLGKYAHYPLCHALMVVWVREYASTQLCHHDLLNNILNISDASCVVISGQWIYGIVNSVLQHWGGECDIPVGCWSTVLYTHYDTWWISSDAGRNSYLLFV